MLYRKGKEEFKYINNTQEIFDIVSAEEPMGKKKAPKSVIGSSAIVQSESGFSLSSSGLNEVLFYLYIKEVTAKASAKQSGSKLREQSKIVGFKRSFE